MLMIGRSIEPRIIPPRDFEISREFLVREYRAHHFDRDLTLMEDAVVELLVHHLF
jgi:hypothetical protein